MFAILIIFGWVVALGCLLFLGVETVRNRRSASQLAKLEAEERQRDRDAGRETQHEAMQPATHPLSSGARRGLWLAASVVLALWEIFWAMEIANYFSEAAHPLQLPYFFLFVVMIGIPLGAYLLLRRQLRHTVVRS